jgi:hypothetical protein
MFLSRVSDLDPGTIACARIEVRPGDVVIGYRAVLRPC